MLRQLGYNNIISLYLPAKCGNVSKYTVSPPPPKKSVALHNTYTSPISISLIGDQQTDPHPNAFTRGAPRSGFLRARHQGGRRGRLPGRLRPQALPCRRGRSHHRGDCGE